MENAPKAVIFDFDGTLYNNSKIPLRLVFSKLLDIKKISADRTFRHKYKGHDFGSQDEFTKTHAAECAKISGCKTPEKYEAWYKNVYMPLMVSILKKTEDHYEGADKVLESLKKNNIKIAVFSDYSMVKERMEAIGLDPAVADLTVSSEEMGALKPAISPFLKIAEKFGVSPSETLVIGDRFDTDGIGAFTSEMKFIQVVSKKTKKLLPDGKDEVEIEQYGNKFMLMNWRAILKKFV